jgi:hypothetical protein
MKKKIFNSIFSWTTLLTISVFLFAFILPVLPETFGYFPARLFLTFIIIAGIYSIDKKKNYLVYLVIGAVLMNWVSVMFNFWFLASFSKLLNIIFFLIVVITLIWQVASAKIVTTKEILESISGYLLIGIIYSIIISFIMHNDPAAYNVASQTSTVEVSSRNLSVSSYYGYVTLASLGYGDIVPLKPYTRSLATFICITGQLYIAILIALLVGKYASNSSNQR